MWSSVLLLSAILGAFFCPALALTPHSTASGTAAGLFANATPARCSPAAALAAAAAAANLTADEIAALSYVCIPPEDLASPPPLALSAAATPRSGIPPGVSCDPTTWCDSGQCTEVCARGSVAVPPWLAAASRLQARLARSLPLCFATLFGTHNSAISLADGYGNLDPVYQSLFKYVKWASADFRGAVLRTNDQWLSLTDQLNLGVRVVEIDTHWFQGVLKVAHCGGLHVGPLNSLVRALNAVARLLGHHVRWDTETLGCDPSLSSIPAGLQRTLADALAEVRAWLDTPANAGEFLIVFFDDQPNLGQWGVARHLKETAEAAFPGEWVFTRDDLEAESWRWPAAADMVAAGKRLMFVSVSDYGEDMAPLIFARGDDVCGWREPPLRNLTSAPTCEVRLRRRTSQLFVGSLVRVSSCELEYGPLNCDFVWRRGNSPIFDETSIPGALDCGLNMPAPDLLTPARAASAVWTWAEGHPYEAPDGATCTAISAAEGRWRAVECGTTEDPSTLPSACRKAGQPLDSDDQWALGLPGQRGVCPEGTAFDVPRHPRENFWLAQTLRDAGVEAAWLPVEGPDWAVDDIPAWRPSSP